MTIEEQWPEFENHLGYAKYAHLDADVVLSKDQYNEARKAVLNHDKLIRLCESYIDHSKIMWENMSELGIELSKNLENILEKLK